MGMGHDGTRHLELKIPLRCLLENICYNPIDLVDLKRQLWQHKRYTWLRCTEAMIVIDWPTAIFDL